MSDKTRERYISAVNIICEQFGLEKPSQIIYVCEAVDRLVESYRIENEALNCDLYNTRANLERITSMNEQLEKENTELKEQNKDLCESLDIMNNRESDLLEQIEQMKNLYKEGIPEDKDRLCIFYDGEYYIDTFNNLSSSEQKQLIKWCYLSQITER